MCSTEPIPTPSAAQMAVTEALAGMTMRSERILLISTRYSAACVWVPLGVIVAPAATPLPSSTSG